MGREIYEQIPSPFARCSEEPSLRSKRVGLIPRPSTNICEGRRRQRGQRRKQQAFIGRPREQPPRNCEPKRTGAFEDEWPMKRKRWGVGMGGGKGR